MNFFKRKKKKRDNKPKSRPWAVSVAGILLIIQSIGFFLLSAANFPTGLNWQPTQFGEYFGLMYHLIPTTLYGFLGFISFLASIDFLRIRPNAWSIALGVQGFALFGALVQYFGSRPLKIYPMMAYCIFMVIYLHHNEVQEAFEQKHKLDRAGGEM